MSHTYRSTVQRVQRIDMIGPTVDERIHQNPTRLIDVTLIMSDVLENIT